MSTQAPTPYVYKALVESVYDGDTLTATLDLGLRIKVKVSCRLLGIDTPEIRTKNAAEKTAGYKARDRVRDLVAGQEVVLHSVTKPDKYGRLLVKVWTTEGVCINDLLIEEGHARAYDGGRKISWAEWT
jgi:micrococcal nuclease